MEESRFVFLPILHTQERTHSVHPPTERGVWGERYEGGRRFGMLSMTDRTADAAREEED